MNRSRKEFLCLFNNYLIEMKELKWKLSILNTKCYKNKFQRCKIAISISQITL